MHATPKFLFAACILMGLQAGCAKKPPKDLPPPSNGPVQTDNEEFTNDRSLEALRQDFVAQAGSDTVYFVTDSALIDAASRTILDAQASWLAAHPRVTITIEGHCDERGTREYNLALGDRRAIAAKNYLAQRGIDSARMRTVSWGKERPAATGSDEGAWAQNRRAVTILVSTQ